MLFQDSGPRSTWGRSGRHAGEPPGAQTILRAAKWTAHTRAHQMGCIGPPLLNAAPFGAMQPHINNELQTHTAKAPQSIMNFPDPLSFLAARPHRRAGSPTGSETAATT